MASMKSIRVVLEGLPGAGKTTLATRLAQRLDCPLVPEWVGFRADEWVRSSLRTPFYFANDEMKEQLASYVSKGCVLMDRHYASTLAFAYGLDGEGQPNPRGDETYAGNHTWYRRGLATGSLRQAGLVLMLDIPPRVSLERQPGARTFDPIVWGEPERLEAIRRFYGRFFREEEPTVRVCWLDGTRAPGELFERALEAIHSCLEGTP
ncbi:AAA family ATPase [Hyalangium rubrum]|uniref:AAA family ATPase n=1 Tax=Hyalangium rubrum TaxID=3103134 RepID=A0ABU5H8P5_9BACT|nr:AAA family ATPase [Hyalangium sp. s54d21]MDY7229492.1 AAA family ATPase [Hyalangium sp. s54d21]